MRDLISLLPAIVLLVIEVPSVHPLYVDMYGKFFQVDNLFDCTVYIYDRVVDMQGPKASWCYFGNIDIGADDKMLYPYIYGIYFDDIVVDYDGPNTFNLLIYNASGTYDHQKLISRDCFTTESSGNYEDVNATTMIVQGPYGRDYFILQETDLSSYFKIVNYRCTNDSSDSIHHVYYNRAGHYVNATVEHGACENGYEYFQHSVNGTKIAVRKFHRDQNCTVGNLDFKTRLIEPSYMGLYYGYDMFKNLSESFPPELYVTETPIPYGYFDGVFKKNGKLLGPWGEPLKRPPIKRNYTEVPFFFVSNNGSSYSPLFLYYKYVGHKLDFAVRFYYNNNSDFRIIGVFKYSKPCGFDDDNVTVVAAPRVLKQSKTSITLEVRFYQNKVDFKFCVFEITYNYATKQHRLRQQPTSFLDAYVHVETRSKTAVNCQYENRTVNWLLAYTEKQEAELISLDNDVSSPIFPCPLCGPDTVMYCDVNPKTAETYDSAVFLITGNEIRFIGVKKSMKYIKRIEYYITKTPDELYFAQLMDLSLFVDGSYKKPKTTESPPKHLTTESPPELQTTKSPSGVDPVAGTPDASDTDASSNGALGLRYLWITLLSFVILTCTFLTELM